MKVYRSRISIVLAVIMGISCIIVSIALLPIIKDINIYAYLAICAFYYAIMWIAFDIKYIIADEKIKIKCAFINMGSIEIKDIRSIENTNSILSAPAASLKRISIRFGKYDDALLSPRNQEDFIQELLKYNPNIEVKV